jgi:hypothetical protein
MGTPVPQSDLPGGAAVPTDDLPGGSPAVAQQPTGQVADQSPNALGPWASAAVRPLVEGAAALPGMAADAGVAARNLVTGHFDASSTRSFLFGSEKAEKEGATPAPSQALQHALDQYTTRPDTFMGKAAETVSSILTGGFLNPEGIGIKSLDQVPNLGGALTGGGRVAAVREAQQAGFRMPPEDSLGANLASIAGKAKLERQLSIRNADRADELVKLGLQFPAEHPLSPQALDVMRDQAARPYEQLANTGDVRADEEFMNDVATAGAAFSKVDRAFPREPGMAPTDASSPDASQIEALKGRYFQPQFSARESIDAMKQLRKDSATNLKNYDPNKNALGVVQRQIADAFEARLERHAGQSGAPNLVPQLRAARVRIAQTYAVQDAMNPATGRVSALALGRAYENGAPLTGELATVARAALTSPKAFKDADKLGKEGEFSVVDFLVAAGAYLHNPSLGAAVVARPAIRKYLESQMAQRMSAPGAGGQTMQGAIPGMAAVAGAEQTQPDPGQTLQ